MSFWHGHIWRIVNVDKWAYGAKGRPHTSIHLICDCGATKSHDAIGDLGVEEINMIAEKKGWRGRVQLKTKTKEQSK